MWLCRRRAEQSKKMETDAFQVREGKGVSRWEVVEEKK
jgi:hypothetical protein